MHYGTESENKSAHISKVPNKSKADRRGSIKWPDARLCT